jgi:predicted nucleotidyltransferase
MENIEKIKNNLTDYDYQFLTNLQRYIDSELIFFGSIKRCDFFIGKSDIDIAIITDNVESVKKKLQNYLNIGKSRIKKSMQKIPNSNKIVYGYKINFDDAKNNLYLEIIIYDEQYRSFIINNIEKTTNLPFYITIIYFILKFLTYYLMILPNDVLKYCKNFVMNNYLEQTLSKNLITLKI